MRASGILPAIGGVETQSRPRAVTYRSSLMDIIFLGIGLVLIVLSLAYTKACDSL